MQILEWLFSRFTLDPDAGSFLLLLGLLVLFGVATAVVVLIGNILYIKLWRWNRHKKQRRKKLGN